jgi:hypothetical protein
VNLARNRFSLVMKKSVSFHSQFYVIGMLLICRRAQNNSCAIKIKVTGNNPSLIGNGRGSTREREREREREERMPPHKQEDQGKTLNFIVMGQCWRIS